MEIVREIHAEAIPRFGGSDGLRELALLESAVAANLQRAACLRQSILQKAFTGQL